MERSFFAKNLIYHRKTKGLSQIDLAEKTGISKRMIAYYELKSSIPSIEVLNKLSNALGVSIRELVDPQNPNDSVEKLNTWTLKKVQLLEQLPQKDQRKVTDYIKALIVQNNEKQKAAKS